MIGLLLAVVATAGLTAALTRPTLRWLTRWPTSRAVDDEDPPPDYAALGTTRFVAACAVLAGLYTAIAWPAVSTPARPLWLVLSSAGVLLVAIDARTTWLPLRLTQAAWMAGVVAGVLQLLIGGSGWDLGRTLIGAAVAGGIYLLVWRISRGGIGFGDVRLAPLIGAASAAHSWRLFVLSLFLGSVVGGCYGLVRLIGKRRTPFPYAPAMLAGAYLGCLAEPLLTSLPST